MKTLRKLDVAVLSAGMISAIPFQPLTAADVEWQATSGLFTDDANWLGGVAPTNLDNAIVGNGGTATIQTDDFVDVSRLLIQGGSTVEQTGGLIHTVSSGTFQSPGAYAIGDGDGQVGTYTISGNSELTGGRVRIGYAGGTGTVTITDTAKYTGDGGQDTWLGNGVGSVGSLTMTLGSEWNIANDSLVVGRSGGTGRFTMSDNTKLTSTGNDLYFGDGGGTQSTSTLNDSAKIEWTNTIRVGNGGATSTVTLNGGSTMSTSAGPLWVGQDGGTNGTLYIKDNAVVTVSNDFAVIGRGGGTGTVEISGNGQLIKQGDEDFYVADQANSHGTLTVNGGSVSINSSLLISNGDGTQGTVNLNAGTITVNNWVAVGRDGSSNGTLNVNGGTFTKTGGGNFILNGATGTLNQTGGAINVNSGETWLSEFSGKNSTWNATGGTASLGNLRVGQGGTGTMNIGGTANYTATTVTVGNNAGSVGTLNLNGGTLTTGSITENNGTGTVNFNGGRIVAAAPNADFFTGFENADITVQAGGLVFDTNGNAIGITQDLAGVGGLVKFGDGTLTLSGLGNAYAGNTEIFDGTLSITTGFLADGADVGLTSVSIFDLNFTGTDTINALFIDGVAQPTGTWGRIGSNADHENALFTGDGLLLVTSAVPEPSTAVLLFGGIGLAAWRLRRARRA